MRESTRVQRHEAIIKTLQSRNELDLDEVNQNLNPNYRFSNMRELSQVARQVKDRVILHQ